MTYLAKGRGDAILHVAHAHEEPLVYGEIAVYTTREKMEAWLREESERVLAAAEAVLREAGVRCEKHSLVGPVGRVLAERAAALGCDAIVMGTHGRTALANILIGSTATKVIHFSDIPVTLVK
jgi:nucleotide-binding universal stress UspA family protein